MLMTSIELRLKQVPDTNTYTVPSFDWSYWLATDMDPCGAQQSIRPNAGHTQVRVMPIFYQNAILFLHQ